MSNANETEMTLKRAHEIIGQVESLSGNTKEYPLAYWEARALIAGHAAASKEKDVYREALEKIAKVTQFDHPKGQIISSEEYEGAWLDCIEIAQEALSKVKP